jgi:hypothetical protein
MAPQVERAMINIAAVNNSVDGAGGGSGWGGAVGL